MSKVEYGPFWTSHLLRGDVDVLVNNAGNAGGVGWPGVKPFAETDPADWEPLLRELQRLV